MLNCCLNIFETKQNNCRSHCNMKKYFLWRSANNAKQVLTSVAMIEPTKTKLTSMIKDWYSQFSLD